MRVSGLRPHVPAALILWPGARSYTGQPLAEIHTIGSPPILDAILAAALADGARLAERGEFTLRAFLSGRIDLTQAEAVLGVIEAEDARQLQAALTQLAGGIASPIARLRDRLLDLLAWLEANLDFVEEPDVDPLSRARITEELATASAEVRALASRLRGRDRTESLARVVLVGPPNAGKSRLFNALLGDTRAIVSPVAGTTRDYLSAELSCGGLAVELIDTAGREAARSEIEAQAQAFREEQAANADLLVECRPAGVSYDNRETRPTDRPSLSVYTKADLAPCPAPGNWLATSAATGEGLGALRSGIADALRSASGEGSAVMGTSARCRDSLMAASDALQSACSALTLNGGEELVAIDLRQALDDLGRVVGAVVTEDILDRIFGRFCIGK